MHPRLARADASVLVVVDIQERLFATMAEADRARVERRVGQLLGAAETLGVPVIATEQYPKGLGPTVPAVAAALPAAATRLDKTAFSCCGADPFLEALAITGRGQVVLAGIESHVCVLQTALDLEARDLDVHVAIDATCAREPANAANAAERLRQAGVVVTNAESVLFEWLRDAAHEHFKAVSRLLK